MMEATRQRTILAGYTGKLVSAVKLLALEQRGWARWQPTHAGRVSVWEKYGDGFSVVLTVLPGVLLESPLEDPEQKLGPIQVLPDGDETVELSEVGELEAGFFSELERDLATLLA
jgi:hypothetical protein